MAIDFSLPDDIVKLRDRVRTFIETQVQPVVEELEGVEDRSRWATGLDLLF